MTVVNHMSREKIKDIIRGAVAHVAELDPQYIEPQTHFLDDLGMDSMLLVEVLTMVEKKLSIQVEEKYLKHLVTLDKCMAIVETVTMADDSHLYAAS